MKALFASMLAALFALAAVSSYAIDTTGSAVYNSDEKKDEQKPKDGEKKS